MVSLQRMPGQGSAAVIGKLENRNPTGSIKDRIALAMVTEAEESGRLRPGFTLVDASIGNTGISLAMVAAAKGYPLIIAMPENAPTDRKRLLTRFGADLFLTSPVEGMDGAARAVERMVRENPEFCTLGQFENPANPRAHRETTAQEIVRDTEGRIDAFVAGVGTGGTITGVGEVLKELNPNVLIVAVEPASSPLLSRGRPGDHGIPGLGPDFVPQVLNRDVIDQIIGVSDEEAYQTSGRLAQEEALLVGISSGANVFAALQVAEQLGPGKVVVTILPDGGERYVYAPF